MSMRLAMFEKQRLSAAHNGRAGAKNSIAADQTCWTKPPGGARWDD
jgi:hypothetical protein